MRGAMCGEEDVAARPVQGMWRLVLAACACVLVAPAASWAGKSDPAFTIANYPVDATADNAVAAKDRALTDGQEAAFRSLLKRIVPVTSYKQLTRLKGTKASQLISGVAVRSEQNSATQYLANLDFSYHADAVRGLLQSQGIPFVETQAAPITVIPILMQNGEPRADAGWLSAWKGMDLEHTLTPIKLEELKPVIHKDTVSMLLNGDDSAQRILSGEYKSEMIVVAIAEPDTQAKRFNVTLSGQDAVGPLFLKRSYRMSDGDMRYAEEFAAIVSLGVLEGRWKAVRAAPAAAAPADTQPVWRAQGGGGGGGETVRLTAEFQSLAQWNEIRTQLLDTPGVDGMEIATVSARAAEVTLSFPGGGQALANTLGSRGLSMTDSDAGWTIRSAY